MNDDLWFSFLDVFLLYLVVVPTVTLAGKVLLSMHWRKLGDVADYGCSAVYTLLISLVLVPLLVFASAAIHQMEPGRVQAVCRLGHVLGEQAATSLLIQLGMGASILFLALRRRGAGLSLPSEKCVIDQHPQALRVKQLFRDRPRFRILIRSIRVIEKGPERICTRGLLRPHIEIDANTLEKLDDRAALAALLHEAEHLQARDPLRYGVAGICLALNPAAFLLRPEFARWRRAREVACDKAAVLNGACPLSLAQALVVVARPQPPSSPLNACLVSHEVDWLRLRIDLLLSYARRHPVQSPHYHAVPVLLLMLLPVVAPHLFEGMPLQILHDQIESCFMLLLAG